MRRTALRGKQTGLIAAGGVALILLLVGSLSLILTAGRSGGARMLERAFAGLEQLENYNLTIIEKAPQYKLSFQGRVEKGVELSGQLPDYELEIKSKDNRLLLKQQEAPEWVQAEELGLQGLAGFLITPLELMQGQKSCFGGAVLGDAVDLGGLSCKTAYFTPAQPENMVGQLFPQVDCTAIDEVLIGAAIGENDSALKQLRILVEFGGEKNEQIERCYYIDP